MKFKSKLAFPFLIAFLLSLLFINTNPQRDWSVAADQEFTLAYNATLINAGINQDYYDHPGFFTIHLLAGILKILKYFGTTSISTINDLNDFNPFFSGLSEITMGAHFLSFLTIGFFCLIWYFIANSNLKNGVLALALAACLIFSGSLSLHLSQLRTEPIAFLLLLIYVFFIFRLMSSKIPRKVTYLFLAIIFLLLSALNKTQIIFYAPVYTFWVLFFYPHKFTTIKLYYQHPTQLFLALLSITLTIMISIKSAIPPSQHFIVFFLFVCYALIYLYWIKSGGNLCAQIVLLNLSLITIFLTLQHLLKLSGANYVELLKQIQSPLVMLMFAKPEAQNAIALDSGGLALNLLNLPSLIINPIKAILVNLNSQSVLFYVDLFLLGILRKRLNEQEIIAALVSLLCFLAITLISSARGLQPQYIIFSEFFLIIIFIRLLGQIINTRLQTAILVITSSTIFFLGAPKLWIDLNNSSNQYALLCIKSNDYMRWWHPKLNYSHFLEACKTEGY